MLRWKEMKLFVHFSQCRTFSHSPRFPHRAQTRRHGKTLQHDWKKDLYCSTQHTEHIRNKPTDAARERLNRVNHESIWLVMWKSRRDVYFNPQEQTNYLSGNEWLTLLNQWPVVLLLWIRPVPDICNPTKETVHLLLSTWICLIINNSLMNCS